MATRTIWLVDTIQTFATREKAKATADWLANNGCTITLAGKEIETTLDGEKRWQEKERLEREA